MSEEHGASTLGIGLEPEDLDGHTIEELAEYLEAGRQPSNPSIEASPGCRIALDALARIRSLSPQLLAADTAVEAAADEGWVQRILSGIAADARAGRRIPLPAEHPAPGDLGITEGAVRGLVRAAEHAVPGVLIGRCRLDGEIDVEDAPVRVTAEVSVPYGASIPDLAERLRAEISSRLAAHTRLNVVAIDVVVQDVQPPLPVPAATGAER